MKGTIVLADHYTCDPMLDMFLFETNQLIEQLEQVVMASEKANAFSSDAINEVFRITHTVKGSAAMMLFDNIATLAHAMEDVFFYLRETKPENADYARLFDLVLTVIDFFKSEMGKIKNGAEASGDASNLIGNIQTYLTDLKTVNPSSPINVSAKNVENNEQRYYVSQQKSSTAANRRNYKATVYFQADCEMENIRAYTVVHGLKDLADNIYHIPEDIIENDGTAATIRDEGFTVFFASECCFEDVCAYFNNTVFLRDVIVQEVDGFGSITQGASSPPPFKGAKACIQEENEASISAQQSMVGVHVTKLDRLMDLVGELVVAEAMVTQNPDLKGLTLDKFQKAAWQLGKITGELQDIVMSIRMVPLAATFHKMQRGVRDMCKKLDKKIEFELIGAETEVDKNIIERISDPLMHLIRNAIDHGIESTVIRQDSGKKHQGKIILEAKNVGNDVLIIVKDDGHGLDKDKILLQAQKKLLVHKPVNELTDKEIYDFILYPGFSTKEEVTEFSGRGVGMDVVINNIHSVGGSVLVDSIPGQGTTISLKIPLTMAIIDGMTIGVSNARYTIPTTAIRESIKIKAKDIVIDADGNEMIMVRGNCYPVLRIHHLYKVETAIKDLTEGIIIMVECDSGSFGIFADELIGEQQVVVKALPHYIRTIKRVAGIGGCTLLGDGSISLILDVAGLMNSGYSD